MRESIGLKLLKTSSIFLLLLCGSCYRVQEGIEPTINYSVQDRYLKQLPSPFPELSQIEKGTDWGKEYLIGIAFARQLDFYRAITSFRRAEILAPSDLKTRRLEMQYEILLCYYMGRRYEDVDAAFTQSDLSKAGPEFPAFHDLLVILQDTYEQLGQKDRAEYIHSLIEQTNPELAQRLSLSSALLSADLPSLRSYACFYPSVDTLVTCYDQQKKSSNTASLLNAILPGSGYLYLGQKQTAITSFLMNGLFTAASVYFFMEGPIAAGIIFASFEAGWYFGGVYGGALNAKFYNERLYESMATPLMNREGYFPIFQLKYAF